MDVWIDVLKKHKTFFPSYKHIICFPIKEYTETNLMSMCKGILVFSFWPKVFSTNWHVSLCVLVNIHRNSSLECCFCSDDHWSVNFFGTMFSLEALWHYHHQAAAAAKAEATSFSSSKFIPAIQTNHSIYPANHPSAYTTYSMWCMW